jgi:polar amino acid transport system ATP-binding protein
MRLELQGVSKTYQGRQVLRGVNLQLSGMHCVAVVGPSGSGKSTLLRILAGLEIPEEGRILWDGDPLGQDARELLRWRRTVGFVFQSFNLFPHLTALENLLLPLEKAQGFPKPKAQAMAWEALKRLGLEEHAHKKPAELSGGMRQRVAIARALVINPKILFLDEPTSALDPESTWEVLQLIGEIAGQGKDLILVTHHIGFARSVADWGLFLAGGSVVEHGPAQEFFLHPKREEVRRFFQKLLY